MSKTETQTRSEIINMQLARSGWFGSRFSIIQEAPLSVVEDQLPYGYESANKKTERLGFADYLLLGAAGKPLAVVEAKRTRETRLPFLNPVFLQHGQQNWLIYRRVIEI